MANTPSASWRTFEVVTHVELLQPDGVSHIWLPAPLIRNTPYQRTISTHYSVPGGKASLTKSKQDVLAIVSAVYPANAKPALTMTSRVALKDYIVDVSTPEKLPAASRAELDYFLQPSRYVPTDGIVKQTALKATAGATTDIDKARAIYEWGNLGGKCADLNALYVGLARSVGLPARHVYGLRIAESDRGYKSLGVATGVATKGQHCRAEVYLQQHGWVPVDPADVRKVALEERPGGLQLKDDIVARARASLFGSWEMNWMAYNYAHDVALPGSAGKPLVYFMYPQAETSAGRVDPFDPDNFKYNITAKEYQLVP
jgi:transglutaminase-like putative cysteine protease